LSLVTYFFSALILYNSCRVLYSLGYADELSHLTSMYLKYYMPGLYIAALAELNRKYL